MTFDPYANQGGGAAWDPEQAAATKKAAEKLFAEADADIEVDDVITGPFGTGPAETSTVETSPAEGDEDIPPPDDAA